MDFRPGVKVQYTEISIAPTLFLWETHAMQMILLAVLGFCALVASAQDKPEIPDDLLDTEHFQLKDKAPRKAKAQKTPPARQGFFAVHWRGISSGRLRP